MNRYMQEKWSWVEGGHGMRMELLDNLSDADLAFNPGGKNLTFGELFRQNAEIEHSYVQSLKTFKQDWSYRNTEAGLDGSVARLKAWFQKLDDEMKEAVSAFSDEDLKKTIDRGGPVPIEMQMEIYVQAVLIFLGKAVVYLQAMNRPLTQPMRDYIG
jgi:hypothetical protein